MAEGILRHEAGDLFEVLSAGSKPAGYVHPKAIEALAEIGIDISRHHSKHLDQFLNDQIDVVITVCDNANESCPIFPGKTKRHHYGFEDPPKAVRPGESELDAFRRIRDEIRMVFTAYADGCRDALEPVCQTPEIFTLQEQVVIGKSGNSRPDPGGSGCLHSGGRSEAGYLRFDSRPDPSIGHPI